MTQKSGSAVQTFLFADLSGFTALTEAHGDEQAAGLHDGAGLLPGPADSHGLTVLVPDLQDRAAVHAIIYDELCQGIVLDSSRDRYREVIARLTAAGAQGVILGCTEIELLVTQADSPVPVFPTTRLHAQAAVERALAPVVTRQ